MSFLVPSPRQATSGRVAVGFLTIPVLSVLVLAGYVGLRLSQAESAPVVHASATVSSAALSTPSSATSDDAAIRAHEALDPVGVGSGRYAAP